MDVRRVDAAGELHERPGWRDHRRRRRARVRDRDGRDPHRVACSLNDTAEILQISALRRAPLRSALRGLASVTILIAAACGGAATGAAPAPLRPKPNDQTDGTIAHARHRRTLN